jgi:hypothetical protein
MMRPRVEPSRDAHPARTTMNRITTLGAAATAAWVRQHGLDVARTPHWYVEISVPTDSVDIRLEINLYPEEWGVVFRRGNRVSSVRVTDVPFVHGLDDHKLLSELPELARIDDLLAVLERRYDVAFHRTRVTVRSNLTRATAIVRSWLVGQR